MPASGNNGGAPKAKARASDALEEGDYHQPAVRPQNERCDLYCEQSGWFCSKSGIGERSIAPSGASRTALGSHPPRAIFAISCFQNKKSGGPSQSKAPRICAGFRGYTRKTNNGKTQKTKRAKKDEG